jgi:hypothetical protein
MLMKSIDTVSKLLSEYDNPYEMLKQFMVISENLNKEQLNVMMWNIHAMMCDVYEDELWENCRNSLSTLGE